MKKLNKKPLVLLVCVALLLTCAVGSTVAYLAAGTDPLTNTFTPGKVTTTIDETFSGKTKESIVIKNTGTVTAYVRVAIVANWAEKDGDEEVIVRPATADEVKFDLGTDWTKIGDYYYYTKPVPAEKSTSNLLGTEIKSESESPYLVITVLQQSIQAEPKTAVENMWPDVKVQDDKTLAERSGQ